MDLKASDRAWREDCEEIFQCKKRRLPSYAKTALGDQATALATKKDGSTAAPRSSRRPDQTKNVSGEDSYIKDIYKKNRRRSVSASSSNGTQTDSRRGEDSFKSSSTKEVRACFLPSDSGVCSQPWSSTSEDSYKTCSAKEKRRPSLLAISDTCRQTWSSTSRGSYKTCPAKDRKSSFSPNSSPSSQAESSKSEDSYTICSTKEGWRPSFSTNASNYDETEGFEGQDSCGVCLPANASLCYQIETGGDNYKTFSSSKLCKLSLARNSCRRDQAEGSASEDSFKIRPTKEKWQPCLHVISRSYNKPESWTQIPSYKTASTKVNWRPFISTTSSFSSQMDKKDTRLDKDDRKHCNQPGSPDCRRGSEANSLERRWALAVPKEWNKSDQTQHSPNSNCDLPIARVSCLISQSSVQVQNSKPKNPSSIPVEKKAFCTSDRMSSFLESFRNLNHSQNVEKKISNNVQKDEFNGDTNRTYLPSEKPRGTLKEESRETKAHNSETAKSNKFSKSLQAIAALEEFLLMCPRTDRGGEGDYSKAEELPRKSSEDSEQEDFSTRKFHFDSNNNLNKSDPRPKNPKPPDNSLEILQALIASENLPPIDGANSKWSGQIESSSIKNAGTGGTSAKATVESVSFSPGRPNKFDDKARNPSVERAFDASECKLADSIEEELPHSRNRSKKTGDSGWKESTAFPGGYQTHLVTERSRLVFSETRSVDQMEKSANGSSDVLSRGDETKTSRGYRTHFTTDKSRLMFARDTHASDQQSTTSGVGSSYGNSDCGQADLKSEKPCLGLPRSFDISDQKKKSKFGGKSGGYQTFLTSENSRLVYSKTCGKPNHEIQGRVTRESNFLEGKQTRPPEAEHLISSIRADFEPKLTAKGGDSSEGRNYGKLKRVRSGSASNEDDGPNDPFKNEHIRIISAPSRSGGFPCLWCKEVFSSPFSQRRHVARHLNEDEKEHFCCCFCNKKFHRRDQLKRHELSHKSDRPHQCNKCGARFKYRDNLTRHEKRDSCFKAWNTTWVSDTRF